MVLDPLMNLFTLRLSQVCCQVAMHFSYHSLPWHSIFVLKTKTSASTSQWLIQVNKEALADTRLLVTDVGS